MPTKITLIVDDKTGKGFESVSRGAKKADKSISDLKSASTKSRTELARLWKEGRTASQVFERMTREAIKAASATESVGKSAGSASGNLGKLNRGSQNFTRGMLEASRGAEDFAIQLGPQGVGGALRAASNNISQMAFVMGGPFAGAIAGAGIALSTILVPALFDTVEKTDDLSGSLDGLFDAFGRLKSGEAELGKLRLDGVMQDEVSQVRQRIKESKVELEVLRSKGREIAKQIDAAKAIKELAKGNVVENADGSFTKRTAEEISKLEERAAYLSDRIKRILKDRVKGETDALGIQSATNEVLDEFIEKSREQLDTVNEEGNAELRLQDQRAAFVRKYRNDGIALRKEFAKLDEAELKRNQDLAIQQEKSKDALKKKLEEIAKKEESIIKKLKDAAKDNKLEEKEKEKGIKNIIDLQKQEVKIKRRIAQLDRESLQVIEKKRQLQKKMEEDEQSRFLEKLKRENDLAESKFKKKMQKEFGLLQGKIASSGFGSQIKQIAGGISQGELLRQAAESRIEDQDFGSKGQKEKAIRKAMKDIRKGIATGEAGIGKELQDAQSTVIQRKLAKLQQFDKVGINKAFQQSQKNQAKNVLGGNVNAQQIQQAQIQVSKSSINLAQQQGILAKSTAEGLMQAAEAMDELSKEQADTNQRLQQIESFMKGIQEAARRRQSQRRGGR